MKKSGKKKSRRTRGTWPAKSCASENPEPVLKSGRKVPRQDEVSEETSPGGKIGRSQGRAFSLEEGEEKLIRTPGKKGEKLLIVRGLWTGGIPSKGKKAKRPPQAETT